MIPYFFCLLPVLVAGVFSTNSVYATKLDQRRNVKYCWFALLPMAFLMAFRAESIGADTVQYNNMYLYIRFGLDRFIDERIETGYITFLKIITRISSDPQTQHIVISILFITIFGSFLRNNVISASRFAVLFMGLNLFAFYLSAIRQVLAMMICLCSYESIKKRNLIRFALWIGLAYLFHKAAIFFVPAYFVANWKFSKQRIWQYILLFIGLAVMHESLFAYAGVWFDIKYGVEETANGYIMVLLMAIITVFSFWRINQLLELSPNNRFLVQLNVLHMGFWILRLFSRTAERPSMFYTPFTILLIEQLILTIENLRIRFIVNACVMLFFGIYFIYKLLGVGLVPYVFFWQ